MRKFLTLFISLFLLLAFTQPAMAKPKQLRFVQVSDVHYIAGRDDVKEAMLSLVNEINSLDNVEFVIFTGDNIDNPNVKYLHEFLKLTKKIEKPCYFVIGNHDVSVNAGLNKDKYWDVIRYHNWFYPAWKTNYVFKKKGVVFVVVDGAKQVIPGPNGYYNKIHLIG